MFFEGFGLKKWFLKDLNGNTKGPYLIEEIKKMIEDGLVLGDELIRNVDETKWVKVSSNLLLADAILNSITNKKTEPSKEEAGDQTRLKEEVGDQVVEEASSQTPSKGKVDVESVPDFYVPPTEISQSFKDYASIASKKKPTSLAKQKIQTIDLKKKKKKPIAFIAIIIIVIALLLYEEEGDQELQSKVVLQAPNGFSNEMPKGEAQQRYKRSLKLFQAGTYVNYLKAQEELVYVAQLSSNDTNVLALLCLVHRELWPYSKKDNQALETVSLVARRISKIEAIGTNNDICRVVENFLQGNIEHAQRVIDKVLLNNPGEAVFYEFKSEIYAQDKNYMTAISYIDKARSIWKNWASPHIKASFYYFLRGNNNEARAILKSVLAIYPGHSEALALSGILGNSINQILESKKKNLLPPYIDSLALYKLASSYAQNDNNDLALEYATKSLKIDPTNEQVKSLLSSLGGDVSSSETAFMMAKANELFKKGDFLAAQSEFKSIFEKSNNARAALKIGEALWQLNQTKASLDWIKKAVATDPKMLEGYITLADYLSQRYYFDSATGVLQKALRLNLRKNEVFRTQALVALRGQDFKTAESLARQAIKIYDSDVEAHIILSKALYGMSRYQEAYQVTAKSIELDGKNEEAQILYFKTLSKFQSQSVGVEYVQNLINTYPTNMRYRVALAEVYMANQNFIEAEGVLNQVINFDGKNKEAYLLHGQLQEGINKFNEALKSYLKAANVDPTDADPLFNIGVLYYKTKKYQEAVSQFKRVVSVNDRYPLANFYIGKSYLELGDANNALEFAKNEMSINPNLTNPYLLAGEAYMKSKNYTLAQEEFKKAIAISPRGVGVYILLARAYRLDDNLDIAEKMIIKAGQLESGNPDIYKEQGVIYENKGRVDQAITAYDRYIKLAPNRSDVGIIKAKIESLSRVL